MEPKVEKKRVLFICTHNSARSQIAEGLLNALYNDRYKAYSAGTEPSTVNPLAVQVIEEIGIDISHHRSKGVSEFLGMEIEYVVTICDHARQRCPFFPGGKQIVHKGFEDLTAFGGSEEERMALFRQVRDDIRDWIEETPCGLA